MIRAQPGEEERSRIEEVDRLVASGSAGLEPLLAMLTEPSWVVRRSVVAGLASLAELPLARLVALLTERRDSETRLAAVVDALVASSGPVDAAVIPLLQHPEAAIVADAVQVLGRRRSEAALPSLIELLAHPDENVVMGATEAVGRVGGRAAVEALVRAVEHGSFFQAFPAIEVLGRSGDPRAVAPLARLLGQPTYAFEAARALARTGEPTAVAPLLAFLSSGGPTEARAGAQALIELEASRRERFGDARGIPAAVQREAGPGLVTALGPALEGPPPPAELVGMCRLLGWSGLEAALPLLERFLAVPETAAAAGEALRRVGAGDWEKRLGQVLACGDSVSRTGLLPAVTGPALAAQVALCLEDPDAGVRVLAAAALARIGAVSQAPRLFRLLPDPDPRVVQAAASALQSLGGPETERLALEAAGAPTPGARRAALWILGHFGSAASFPLFEAALADPDVRVRDAAIQGLPALEEPRALGLLLSLTRGDDPRLRAQATRALGQCPQDPRVTAQLLRGVADADGWVRYYAAQALGRLAIPASVDVLAGLLQDTAPQVRVAALEALAHLQVPRAVEALLAAARSDELDLRHAALIGLGLQRSQAALPVLLEAAGSSDSATRLLALSALAEVPEPQAFAALAAAARDPDEGVATAAIGSLGASPGVDGATPVLVGLLGDERLRERALAALATPGEDRVAHLSAALEQAKDEVAPWLTAVLLRLGEPGSLPALERAMGFPNPAARKAAAAALASQGAPELLRAVQRAARVDPDPEVRRVCELVLDR